MSWDAVRPNRADWEELHQLTGVSVNRYVDEVGVRHIRINNWEPYGSGSERYVCLDLTWNQWVGLCHVIERRTLAGHSSGSDAGEGAEETAPELFPPGSSASEGVQRTEEQRYPQAGSFLSSSTGMPRSEGIED